MIALDKLAGTGRTTRMLEEAKRLAAEGRSVAIVGDNSREVNRIKILLGNTKGIRVVDLKSEGIDWQRLQLERYPNDVVLVDHHAIEDRFNAIVEMLHRFDEGTGPEGNQNIPMSSEELRWVIVGLKAIYDTGNATAAARKYILRLIVRLSQKAA